MLKVDSSSKFKREQSDFHQTLPCQDNNSNCQQNCRQGEARTLVSSGLNFGYQNSCPLLYSADENQVCSTNSLVPKIHYPVQNSFDQNQVCHPFLPVSVNQERLCTSTYWDEIKVVEINRWGTESSGNSEFQIIPEERIDLAWRVHRTCQEPRDLARHLPDIANSSRRRLVPPSSSRFVPLMMLNPHDIETTSPTVIYYSTPSLISRRRASTVSLAADGSLAAPLVLQHTMIITISSFRIPNTETKGVCPVPCFQLTSFAQQQARCLSTPSAHAWCLKIKPTCKASLNA